MIRSVGVDVVEYARFSRMCDELPGTTIVSILSDAERREMPRADQSSGNLDASQRLYVACHFAAKEAVLKTLRHPSFPDVNFDEIDTRGTSHIDVHLSGSMRELADRRGVGRISGTIVSNERYVLAFMIGEQGHAE